MLYRLSINSFIREFDNIGYITSQLFKEDIVFDEIGAVFLKQIKRKPQETELVVKFLFDFFSGVSFNELEDDFLRFLFQLEKSGFIVTGNCIKELNSKENLQKSNNLFCEPTLNLFGADKEKTHSTNKFLLNHFKKKPRIIDLLVELTNRCNENCIHCYLPNNCCNEDIDTKMLFRVMKEFRNQGGLYLTLSGGECLLNRDFEKILLFARKLDFSISILSNLVLLNENHIKLFKKVGLNQIQVSLYGLESKTHNKITRNKGSFKKTFSAINKLFNENIPLTISCPILKENKKNYKKVLEWANKNNINIQLDFVIMAKSNLDTSNLKHRLCLEEVEVFINNLSKSANGRKEILSQVKDEVNIKKRKNQPLCSVAINSICLSATGDFFPCPAWKSYILGNAFKQTLSEVWLNSKNIMILRKITHNSFPQCTECSAYKYCSKCLVRNANENNGNMLKVSEYVCQVAFLNKQIVERLELSQNI